MAVREVLFDAGAAAHAAGLPVRRLEGWVAREVVRPSIEASGTGSRRRFSYSDVLQIALLNELRQLFGRKLPPGTIASLIQSEVRGWAEDFGLAPGTWMTVAWDRREQKIAFGVGNEPQTIQQLKRCTVAVVVHLDALRRRVDAALRER